MVDGTGAIMGIATRAILSSFNGGEMSPLLEGRVDQEKYYTSSRVLQNFIPTVQGPARRRGGTRYVNPVKTAANRTWLTDFVFSSAQAYVLEFGNLYVRFWTNRGQLLNLGVPYEIVSPYTTADLVTADGTFALRTVQSADVMWIVHAEGKYPPYRLQRLGATNWTLTLEAFVDGPFRDFNTDKTVTMYSSAANSVGSTVTITASSAVFQAGHVGSLLRLSSVNPSSITPYQPAANVAVGDRVRNAGNVYQSQTAFTWVAGDTTQRYVPTHTSGVANDGKVNWLYLHSGYGWGVVQSIGGGGTTCVLAVSNYIPEEVVAIGNTTYRWQFSEISSVYGYPTGINFFKERLCYLRGKQVFMSWPAGFTSFDRLDAGLVTAQTALSLSLAADKLDNIRWANPLRDLIIGTARSESALGSQTQQQVFSATNNVNIPQTEYGARMLKPLRAGDSLLFVERAGHRVRDIHYDFTNDKYKAEDVSVLSEHLLEGSEDIGDPEQQARDIIDWTYQQQRDSLVWCVLSDGNLISMVFNRERGVIGWCPHYIGGSSVFVEAVCSIPSPDGRSDDLWLIVNRTVGGAVQRSVEYMTDYRLVKKGATEAFHVDGGYTYRGAAAATVTGLTWLEGKTVSVCADGAARPDTVVTGGSITLTPPASLVHVGYKFISRWKSMRLEQQTPAGTSQSKMKGIGELYLRMRSTIGGKVGKNFVNMDDIKTQPTGVAVGIAPPLFSGDYKLPFPGGLDRDGFICYQQDQPLPATLISIMAELSIND